MKQNKPADLNNLPPGVAALISSGIPLRKAISMSMLKDKQSTKKRK